MLTTVVSFFQLNNSLVITNCYKLDLKYEMTRSFEKQYDFALQGLKITRTKVIALKVSIP